MNRLAVIGLVAFVLGVGAIVAPWLVPFTPGRALVYVIGLVAFVQAYRVLGARRRDGIQFAATPDPEVLPAVATPGDDLYEAIGDLAGGRISFRQNALLDAAVTVLTRYAGLTADEARDRLAEGTWTDDPLAAMHLGDVAPSIPLRDRLKYFIPWESGYSLRRDRAIVAIAARAGVVPSDEPGARGRASILDVLDAPAGVPIDDDGQRLGTGQWQGVSAVALVAIGIGVSFEVAPVVLAGVVGVGFAAYERASSLQSVSVSIDRHLETDHPEAGDAVEVTLTISNEGDRRLSDLRVVDGVPAALTVTEGSPRLGTTLGAGESATLTYAVEARRGIHEFKPVTVIARDLAGSTEDSRRVPVETTLTCIPTLRETAAPVPLRASTTQYTGRVQTSTGGEGVEFYATRAYQPGDPMNRIDWNRRARTGEFATLQFREERSSTVVVVVDAREDCYRSHDPYGPHAVDRSVEAAGPIVASLLSAGNRVGIAAFGADCWLAPGAGRGHRARAQELLATHPCLSSMPPEEEPDAGWRRRLRHRLPPGAQLIVLSPLCDAESPRLVRTYDALGHPTTVISPDPTVTDRPGRLLAAVSRRVRMTDLRRAGVPVLDWPPEDSLDLVLQRSARRRSS